MGQGWTEGRRRLVLASGLGAVAALGQAPLGFWWATLAALAGLVWLLSRVPDARGAFLTGLFAGAGHFALALNWIVEPFLIDIARHGWMAPFAVVLLSFGLGLFWAGAAALARLTAQPALGFVCCFVALEWLRGVLFTGFPWAMAGHVWIGTPVDQLAALAGPSALSLLTLLAAALPVLWRGRGGLATAALLLALAWGFGVWRLAQPLPAPREAVVRLVQPNAAQSLKWDQALADEFLDRLLDMTAGAPPADLTLWPETAVPYMLEYAPSVAGMVTAASGGRPVAVGIQREEAGRFYNSIRVLEGEREETARYDKAHLVPFGEYIPLGDLAYQWFGLRAFAAQAGATYSAGPGVRVLDLGRFGKVLPLICYEAIFPREVNAMPERADWMLQATNDAWFGIWTGPFQHFAQARLRAVEQGLPLIRVANTGVTAVIDARGRVVEALPFGTMAALDARVPGALPPTPYSRRGDGPLLLLLAGLGLLAMFRRWPAAH
ncbi:apolipoprotein N-acyltransferase [Rhodobacter calidifons]|uniref:Apolipoprotein N-acyltransferase n=1 Tax=Rhodobacter calidifons TaxID=2715277 RepID=A0ABX0G3D8_9RHOB|nr:apolipoprotein N-acyltransferase [Rhodobacter calidifons]NHB75376.1 apolipoprotein N-acyltransferase [Rhodobacter calidifons]